MASHPESLAPVPIDPRGVDEGSLRTVALKVLLGGTANAIASCASNPPDLIKVRQQLLAKSSKEAPTHFVAVLKGMIREEGPMSLLKGLQASMVREMTYSGIRMGTYDYWKHVVARMAPMGHEDGFGLKVVAGMGSGMMGAAIANPADLIKVRMQAPLAETRSFLWHWRDIVSRSGYKGLYRAVLPTTVRASILTSSQLSSYDETKHLLLRNFPHQLEEGIGTHFLASGVAGLVCSVCSAPVDTIKVRLMNDSRKRYRNAIHCTSLLVKEEGLLSLYKGFTMCWLRLWPQTVISLIVFEQLRRIAGIRPM